MRVFRQTVKKGGEVITVKKWYADVRLPDGQRYRLPVFESEKLSKDFATKLETMIGQYASGGSYDKNIQLWLSQLAPVFLDKFISWGLVDAARAENSKPIDNHIDDYIEHLKHKGNTKDYYDLCEARIRNVINGCKVKKLPDLAAVKIQRYISNELTAGRISQGTFNHYIRQMKGFLRWLYREDRIQNDIDKHLTLRTITEVVKDRRALSVDEISYLLNWLQTKAGKRRSLSGWERMVLYKMALTTGLRADELRHLTAASIDFKAKRVQLANAFTKNRKEAVLPLRDDILDDLRTLTENKTPDTPLFRYITDKTAKLLKADMVDARAQWIQDGGSKKNDFLKIETPDGEIDFHGLRHSYGSMLAAAGVHPSIAQKLMRHSTITLTMNNYTHLYADSDAAAVDSIPSFNQKKTKVRKA